jgi:cell division initiation protein
VIQEPEHDFPYYRSPAAIRGETFSHRMRGIDEEEVREYLYLLADQVQSMERERADLLAEVQRLRGETSARPTPVVEAESPRAALVMSQAQQVADQLVEEAVVHARDLLASARHQQREILEAAHRTAEAAAREAAQASARNVTAYVSAAAPEVEYARRFTQVAQVQLRSVLEALCEQVEQLGQMSRLYQDSLRPTYVEQTAVRTEVPWDALMDPIPVQPTFRVVDALSD